MSLLCGLFASKSKHSSAQSTDKQNNSTQKAQSEKVSATSKADASKTVTGKAKDKVDQATEENEDDDTVEEGVGWRFLVPSRASFQHNRQLAADARNALELRCRNWDLDYRDMEDNTIRFTGRMHEAMTDNNAQAVRNQLTDMLEALLLDEEHEPAPEFVKADELEDNLEGTIYSGANEDICGQLRVDSVSADHVDSMGEIIAKSSSSSVTAIHDLDKLRKTTGLVELQAIHNIPVPHVSLRRDGASSSSWKGTIDVHMSCEKDLHRAWPIFVKAMEDTTSTKTLMKVELACANRNHMHKSILIHIDDVPVVSVGEEVVTEAIKSAVSSVGKLTYCAEAWYGAVEVSWYPIPLGRICSLVELREDLREVPMADILALLPEKVKIGRREYPIRRPKHAYHKPGTIQRSTY